MAVAELTIREQIIQALIELAKDCEDEDGNRMFNNVYRGNLDDLAGNPLALPAVGIEEGPEEKLAEMHPFTDKNLSVYVHVKWQGVSGVEPFEKFNYYLGALQKLYMADIQVGGLARNVQEEGNSCSIESDDPQPGGSLILRITYRHVRDNPYKSTYP
jgi:hypothetical protein